MRKTIKEISGKIQPDDPVYDLTDVSPNEMAVLDLALKDRADIMRQVAQVEEDAAEMYLQMAEEAEKLREAIKK
ncbi:hypothetical protein [Alteribacter natronophilus]|uniref:hypothetical protein n=1 Tax=Alteribacter natronophilus TaxID=2583810 RepID=UPI00110F4F9B|nr:hypothetical protein [Alteribacter natronophilus]TMW70126.1 hypothetical protein FGB90_18335 [Alteribacter natronophilus]